MDITSNMTVGRLAGGTSEDGEGERKGGMEGVARFSVCAAGGQKMAGTSGGIKHRGVTGSRQGQIGLVSSRVLVSTS